MMSGGQPAVPLYPGRGQHEIPYSPTHHPPYPPQFHGQHPQNFRQPYYQQPPQQWAYYPGMQGVHRPYPHQYQGMMNAPYPIPQVPPSMSPRPSQHMPPPHAPVRPQHVIYSPPPPDRSMHALPPTPSSRLPVPPAPPPIRMPFYPPLPWYSMPESTFPSASKRRRRKFLPQSPSVPVELPDRRAVLQIESAPQDTPVELQPPQIVTNPSPQIQSTTIEVARSDTPATSQAASESDSTQPTTPSSIVPPRSTGSSSTVRLPGKIVPVVPAVPNLPSLSRPRKESASTVANISKPEPPPLEPSNDTRVPSSADVDLAGEDANDSTETPKPSSPQAKAAPKSWADLVRSKASNAASPNKAVSGTDNLTTNGQSVGKSGSLPDVLNNFSVRGNESDGKLEFLKPRGLVNTGNMCYMNSILQTLLYCAPFFDFLEQVGRNATHSFKSETPMIDAMILFIREFPVIDAATSAEQLRMRLKSTELEEYGESFIPDFVYEVIRRLPRFSSMRRGHQQDAEEFLGFLLEELHEECVRSMKGLAPNLPLDGGASPVTDASQSDDGGWLEVGPKQKAAVTRSSGLVTTESPLTKIFGGKLRSELRVPGAKNSVTLEPYQPLQLDIGSPQVNNIIDALKGLTRSEILHGDFNSPRGPGVSATKQVFIETLPPVLILHLKRFQYDNTGGTQKIWKKVGYPLDLEIPKEVFPPHRRGVLAAKGDLPKYRLIGVVYHHGKSASGGHYTVDVRRQDGREWIRFDDTVIRRVRSEDVAEGGSEEDPKVLAAALEQHKRDQSVSSNIFDQVREEQEESAQAEKGWSQVNGSGHSNSTSKKWSGVVNGTATPTSSGKHTPVGKFSIKDNKVAYILFYQRIGL